MVSPTKDQQIEVSSASEDMDKDISSEGTSTSNPSENELSTFDVVMNAIKPEGEDEDDDAISDKGETGKPEDDTSKKDVKAEGEGESDEPGVDELKAWKPKTRERFEKLQAKHRDVSERLVRAETEAGLYRQFTDFLDTNGIAQDEANKLFNIGAMMKNNPVKALELITPYYSQLLEITGQILPPDLQQQVQSGYLTQAHAVEISRGRAQQRLTPVIAQEQQQRQQQQVVRQQQGNVASMQSAVAAWEQKWSSSDPDYSVKKDRVLDRLELTLARAARSGQLPQNAEQAIKLADKVKAEVEAEFRQTKQRKPVSTIDGNNSGSQHQPEPKDTRDVIRRTLSK